MFECVFDFRSKDLSMDRQSSMPTKHNNKNWSCRTASTFGSECYVLFVQSVLLVFQVCSVYAYAKDVLSSTSSLFVQHSEEL